METKFTHGTLIAYSYIKLVFWFYSQTYQNYKSISYKLVEMGDSKYQQSWICQNTAKIGLYHNPSTDM